MNKKGISPLIATVLIIGFTIALAVVIMTWGFDFFDRLITQGTEDADYQLRCTKIDFDIEEAKCGASGLDIRIENVKSTVDIDGFNVRIYADGESDPYVVEVEEVVSAAALKTLEGVNSADVTGKTAVKVGLIPLIMKSDGSYFSCGEEKEKAITSCTVPAYSATPECTVATQVTDCDTGETCVEGVCVTSGS